MWRKRSRRGTVSSKKTEKHNVLYDEMWSPLEDMKTREDLKVGETRFAKCPIGVVPSTGYVMRDNYSKASIQWLEWVMEDGRRRGIKTAIQHARNGGEYKIPDTNYRCDGYDKDRNTIYEFYGKLSVVMLKYLVVNQCRDVLLNEHRCIM